MATVTTQITLTYTGPAPIIAGQPVNASWAASGGSGGPYTFGYSGALPPGLSLSPNGTLSGIARGAAGAVSGPVFYLTASDNAGHISALHGYAMQVVPAPITVAPSQLPNAVQGQAYSVQLIASGGVAPYTFPTVDTGLGLTMNNQGLISGRPNTNLNPGQQLTYPYIGYVADNNGSRVQFSFQITFQPPAQKRSPQPPPTQPAFADGSLVKSVDQPEVFVVYGGGKFWIPNPTVFNAMGFNWNAIQTLSDSAIAAIPNVPQDGTLLKEQSTPPVYVMQGGAKCHILSSAGVVASGGWGNVRVVPDGALANIPNGNDIP